MIEQFEIVARAAGEASRLRMLKLLEGGELCVCQITAVLGLSPATVSKHLALLRLAGLVGHRRDGRWIYYRLAERDLNPYARPILKLVAGHLDDDPTVTRDRRRLAKVTRLPREALCGDSPAPLASDLGSEALVAG